MPFPPAQRVLYGKNPLNRVVCQLRFPRILRIGAETPVQFQDGIRYEYPLYESESEEDALVPNEVAQILTSLGIQQPVRDQGHRFATSDQGRILVLTEEFLALEEKNYTRWEVFEGHLRQVEEVLRGTYRPAFYSRVGLRYRDIVRRSALGLKGREWRELLNPAMVGELVDGAFSDQIQDRRCQTLIKLATADGLVRISHGLVRAEDEECYLIDADFFTQERRDTDGALADLSAFNRLARYLFRWAITDTLHRAMGPAPLAESD